MPAVVYYPSGMFCGCILSAQNVSWDFFGGHVSENRLEVTGVHFSSRGFRYFLDV